MRERSQATERTFTKQIPKSKLQINDRSRVSAADGVLAAHHRSLFDAPNAGLFRALSRSSAQAARFSRFRFQPAISMHSIQHMRSQRVIFGKTWIVKIVLRRVGHTEPFHDSS
jgi:hypothetical protein